MLTELNHMKKLPQTPLPFKFKWPFLRLGFIPNFFGLPRLGKGSAAGKVALALFFSVWIPNTLPAATFSFSNYSSLPTLMATPQWCPSDPVITYQTNQPTFYSLPTGLTACGYPTNTYDPNHYAAIDSDSFGDTGASRAVGAGSGGFPCGACVALQNGSNATTVVIVDECPQGGVNQNNCWVGSYHLDLAKAAYEELNCGSPTCTGSFPSNSGVSTRSEEHTSELQSL